MSRSAAGAGRVPVAVRTLGCKVNRVESDQIAARLIGRGAELTGENAADVVIVNTCTVTGEADAKARKAVRHALKADRSPVVVVTGCLAALDAEGLAALGERVVVEADKTRVAALVAELLGLDAGTDGAGAVASVAPPVTAGEGFRTRAALKVQDGCDNFCTYCIVPYARGVPVSVPLDEVRAAARALVAAGVPEIVLTGINLGRYRWEGATLADVVAAVAETGVARLRLSSIEPPDLTEELLRVLGSTPSVCAHLHVPLQSGSDSVLAAMGRTYDTAGYRERIEAARAALPGLALTTDLIAGFPSETDDDHHDTLDFVRRTGFSKLHVFRYSRREGTPAARIEPLAAPVTARRAGELRALGDELRTAHVRSRAGEEAELLVESVAYGTAAGTTRDYLRVSVTAPPGCAPGDIVTVSLDERACS